MTTLERFLTVDPRDAGCERTLELLHVFVEDVLAGREPDPAIIAHLRACPPCAEDFDALLRVWR
ncbi:zf-HC2 domain-containing protein [Solirubrobacter soli]|uniref:zf-HC2 domain-containing protein n=1 Tax=Solirubrobacter soli TaxID=363832 RepID=UPI000419C598|nr:zf-HC2 domain-containing protein [Solirubrobacter soli]